MVDLALKNLLHDRLRFAITVVGIAFAVALVLVQLGLFLGLMYNATVSIEKMPAELWVTSRNARNIDFGQRFSETYVHRVRAVPGVARADNLIVTFSELRLPTGGRDGVTLYGMEDFRPWGWPWDVVAGDIDEVRRGANFFIDVSGDHRYGRPLVIGDWWDMQDRRFKIVGRTRDAKSFTTTPLAFMDIRRIQELSPIYANVTSYIVVKLAPGADLETVRRGIEAKLPNNEVLTSKEWASRTRGYWIKSTGLGFSIFVTVFLGCLVGIVIVSQTLYASTMEHLKEFGMVKAIGGTNWDIYKILGRQALVSALLGYGLGLAASVGARQLIQKAGLRVLMPPDVLVWVFVGAVTLCVAAGMVSFHKVARIDPALVFRGM